jgi:hypothetical protein
MIFQLWAKMLIRFIPDFGSGQNGQDPQKWVTKLVDFFENHVKFSVCYFSIDS